MIIIAISASTSNSVGDNFINCMSTKYNSSSGSILSPESPHFSSLLDSKVQNMRYFNSTSRPHFISTPSHHSDIQAAILCAKQEGLQIRVRSGGHDYEGLSYLGSGNPYIIIDLTNLNNVQVDVNSETAWVQSGAQLGELYYGIAKQSSQLGFPGGICPTVGVGGHLGGGGFGTLIRKHGLAADNVIDATLIDARGQQFAHDVHEDLFVRTMILGLKRTNTVQASFQSLFLGPIERLIPVMNTNFPELGLRAENCRMWKLAVEEELSIIILEPLGGRMKEIPESYTPFPHRIGHLYNIQYLVKWEEDNDEEEEKRHIEWMKKLYDYMEAYVSKSPRAAYLNYRDLDIGTNNVDERKTSFMEASVWGKKYFRDNFIKLCKAKTMIDPHNFFSHEQSIPLFH
ncbi:Berberine bridge enzyme-like 28 [Linum perenne]